MHNPVFPAQALPSNVLRLIIRKLVREVNISVHGNMCTMEALKDMLSVCSTWRQAALEYYWKAPRVTIDEQNNTCTINSQLFSKQLKPSHSTTNMVKELYLDVPLSSIVNGTAQKLLIEFMEGVETLPSVRKYYIRVTHHKKGPEYSKDDANNCAFEFAELLKSIAPTLNKIGVSCDSYTSELSPSDIESNVTFDEEILVAFVNSLCNVSNEQSVMKLEKPGFNTLTSNSHIPQLTTLWLYYTSDQDMRINLVHKCANTLQYLTVGICNAKSLVFDAYDNAVVYPYLYYLELYPGGNNTSIEQVSVPSAVPFPILKGMYMKMPYPFSDDVMFRGNRDTLECIDICINHRDVMMLSNSLAFERGRSNRRRVIVNGIWGDDSLVDIPEANMSKFLGNLIGSTKRLQSDNTLLLNRLVDVASRGPGFEFIKDLDAYKAKLTIFNILRILQVLPSLVQLTCGAFGLGPELTQIAADDLPDHMASTYCDTGKNLQVWNLIVSYCSRDTHISEYAMLLALACPKLHSVELKYIKLPDYKTRIADALQSGPYSKYASRLSRLLDIAA